MEFQKGHKSRGGESINILAWAWGVENRIFYVSKAMTWNIGFQLEVRIKIFHVLGL
jgi:hypothetical protein